MTKHGANAVSDICLTIIILGVLGALVKCAVIKQGDCVKISLNRVEVERKVK